MVSGNQTWNYRYTTTFWPKIILHDEYPQVNSIFITMPQPTPNSPQSKKQFLAQVKIQRRLLAGPEKFNSYLLSLTQQVNNAHTHSTTLRKPPHPQVPWTHLENQITPQTQMQCIHKFLLAQESNPDLPWQTIVVTVQPHILYNKIFIARNH